MQLHHLLKIENCKLKILLFCCLFLLFILVGKKADAATISKPMQSLGLVGYWSFDVGKPGAKAVDMSGRGNNGTLTNMNTTAAWVGGKIGNALDFDGSNDYVSIADPGTNSIFDRTTGDSITISVWAKRSTVNGWRPLVTKNTGGTSRNYEFVFSGTGLNATQDSIALFYRNSADTAWVGYSSDATYTDSNWHHYVFTGTFGTAAAANLYVDGIKIVASWKDGTGSEAPITNNGALEIGRTSLPEYFPGLIDEVRVYNRALSATEIQALYNSGAAKFAPPTDKGLVGYWSMNEGTGTVAGDGSGNENRGTLTGGPTWVDGKRGKALNFDGNDDLVNAGSATSLDQLPAITVSAWIYPRNVAAASDDVFSKRTAAGASGWKFGPSSTGAGRLSFVVDYDTDLNHTSNSNVISANVWQHIAISWDGSTSAANARIYINGVETTYAQTTNGTTNRVSDAANPLTIGAQSDGGNPYNGLIDEVRIYNRALSAAEIQTLYNSR